jgi:hypothetical protein
MNVTILSTHVHHALSHIAPSRYSAVALRTALRAACLGHDVTLIVFRGLERHLVAPSSPSGGSSKTVGGGVDAPYQEAQAYLARVNDTLRYDREQYSMAPSDAEGSRGSSDGSARCLTTDEKKPTPSDLDAMLDEIDRPETPEYLRNGEGRLTIEFVAPPPVKHLITGQLQDWPTTLLMSFPAASDCVIDASGPDVLNVSHVDGDARAIKYARTRVARTYHEEEGLDAGEENQHSLGRCDFPSINNVVSAVTHHAQAMRLVSSFVRQAETGRREGIAFDEPRHAKDMRKQDLHDPTDRTKIWFLNDWRALDVGHAGTRVPVVKLPGFKGPKQEGAIGAAAAAGIQHAVRRVWKYSDELGNWSMLCMPPLAEPAPLDYSHSVDELLRARPLTALMPRRYRVMINEVALPRNALTDVMPAPLRAGCGLARLLTATPTVEEMAEFLVDNIAFRKVGLGEELNNAYLVRKMKQFKTLQAQPDIEELKRMKADLSKTDLEAYHFDSLRGLSNRRFLRRRVGVSVLPSETASFSLETYGKAATAAARTIQSYRAVSWPPGFGEAIAGLPVEPTGEKDRTEA